MSTRQPKSHLTTRRGFLRSAAETAALIPLGFSAGCCLFGDARTPRLRFGFMTDTHVTPKPDSFHKLRKALALFKEKGCSLVINAGDIADHFYPEAYALYRKTTDEIFADIPPAERPAELFAYAWHDAYDYKGHPRGAVAEDSPEAFKEVKTLLGATNDPTDVKTIGGYPFLVFPQFIGFDKCGYFGADEYERRVATACAANPGKPVFIVDHIPPYGTVRESWSWEAGRARVLAKYPQVIHLSGHGHGDISNGLFFWQGGFTVMNAGDLFPTSDAWGVVTVDVFDDRVEAHRWDIRTGAEILTDALWRVDLPYEPSAARRIDHGLFGRVTWDSGEIACTLPFAPEKPATFELPRDLFAASEGTSYRVVVEASSKTEAADRGIFTLALVGRAAAPGTRAVRRCTSPSGDSDAVTYLFDFVRPKRTRKTALWNPTLDLVATAGSIPAEITIRCVRVYQKD